MSFLAIAKSFLELLNKIIPDKEERKRRIKEKRKVLIRKRDEIEKKIRLCSDLKCQSKHLNDYWDTLDAIKYLDGVLETY